MMVVVTMMVCYGIYALAVAIGGRPIWFSFGCIWMLPPRFTIIPWSKVDDWEDFLLEETETEQVIFARKKIRQRRLGTDGDLQLEKRLVRDRKLGKTAGMSAGDAAEAKPGQMEPAPESESDALPAAAQSSPGTSQTSDGGVETSVDSVHGATGDQAGDPDVQAALKTFEKSDDNDAEPATNVSSMLGNLWARIPDVPVRPVSSSASLYTTSLCRCAVW
jgi:hypothetical protein